jgi:hypothetical protein
MCELIRSLRRVADETALTASTDPTSDHADNLNFSDFRAIRDAVEPESPQ